MSSDTVRIAFQKRFGTSPEIVAAAPGRVNLIGEHTDYNEGFSIPVAIDRYVWVAASRTESNDFVSLDFSDSSWARYPRGVAAALESLGIQPSPLRGMVHGDLPAGCGLSSSAALEMAFAVAWNELDQLGLSPIEMARAGRSCENDYIGLHSGLMDQAASACGIAGHAVFFDALSEDVHPVALPPDWSIVVADTGVRRELSNSKYNERKAECQAAADLLGVRALRHASIGDLEDSADLMPEHLFRRAQHVITENTRCLRFVDALANGATDEIGKLMAESHRSLRDDFLVSCSELDAMAEVCWSAPGCIGARMTGGGFGGACVALVDREQVPSFLGSVSSGYTVRTTLAASLLVCEASAGARRVL